MNYKTVLAIFACLLLAALPAVAQKKVEFAKFQEYVGDTDHRRRGERFVVPDAPMTEKVAFIKGYQVYYFEAEDGGARQAFYTSAALAKALRQNLNSRAVLMSVTCVLVDFATDQDILHGAFATKVEGINMDGEVVWTVAGPPPAKLTFR